MIDLNNHKLKLEYPCKWCYKIVLKDTDAKKIAKDILGDRTHSVTNSKVSSKGKFQSYNIDLTVHSDEDREKLHQDFKNHKDVKMVV